MQVINNKGAISRTEPVMYGMGSINKMNEENVAELTVLSTYIPPKSTKQK